MALWRKHVASRKHLSETRGVKRAARRQTARGGKRKRQLATAVNVMSMAGALSASRRHRRARASGQINALCMRVCPLIKRSGMARRRVSSMFSARAPATAHPRESCAQVGKHQARVCRRVDKRVWRRAANKITASAWYHGSAYSAQQALSLHSAKQAGMARSV